ncbi:MAG: RNA-binding protein [Desulfoplanes sp.]|nr:RNA-binding protein [Desulfoplanes sp.]
MNIYVGNLSYQMTDDELKTTFQVYGEVESARIITDRDTGRSKGFGFVEMKDNDQAQAAITALNGSDINGRNVTVNEARPKPQRSDRNGGGYGGGRGGYGGGGHGNGRNRY